MAHQSLIRRRLLRCLAIAAAAFGGACFDGVNVNAGETRSPNVVLIVADDLGWADLACYGGDLHETPRLDQFAQQGVRFTQAYAAAPVCTPTRAALMTGKYPARLHMTVWLERSQSPDQGHPLLPPQTRTNLPHEETTLAELLDEVGYLTAHIGKWHLGLATHYPETQGFDINIGGTHWGAPPTFFFPYRGNWSNTTERRYVPDLAGGDEGEYLTDRLTDEALEVIRAAGDRPFFLHLAFHTVHTPIEGKPALVDRYRQRLSNELRHQNADYAAMVHSLDENIGRVLDELDRLGVAENTLVIFTSDNGGYINVHRGQRVTDNTPLRSGKGSLYEGGIRVPLIIRTPGNSARAGKACEEPVITMDLFATVQDLLAAQPSVPDGVSLLPLLDDPDAALDRPALYFHYPHYYSTTTPVSAVRAGPWKLLHYYEDDRDELYHLGGDLAESDDRAASQQDQAARLREMLDQWLVDVSAQLPEQVVAGTPDG